MKNFKEYANSFQAKSILGLESIEKLLEKLNNPHKDMHYIHVAGTNGKGSVCAFLQNILTCSGLKTGKFISPNMIEVYERISIDGENILPEDMNRLLETVQSACAKVKKDTGALPTQFEIWTATAFLYFKEKKCDIVVLETGLGGRLDATNIIDLPVCSVITRIDMDHTEYLGNTIEKVAFEKAGIIKKGCPVITLSSQNALSVLTDRAKELESNVLLTQNGLNIKNEELTEIFDYKEYKELEINLAGIHQVENATLAIEAARLLNIDEEYIRCGLKQARNIGRFEKISENPLIIFDGAHNFCGIKSLITSIKRYFPDEKMSIIFSAMKDKEIDSSIRAIKEAGFADKVYTVAVMDNPRGLAAEELKEKFEQYGFTACACENIKEAIKKATLNENATLVCGSLYLYKDLKES